MSEYTPSQAEGDRDDDMPTGSAEDRPEPPRTTPSQAEGERDDDESEEDPRPRTGPEGTRRPDASGPVTRDHVRELLAAREDSATLVLLEGRARVIAAAERNTDWYAGAVEVMSGAELADRIGTDSPSERELDVLAGTLNTMVAHLGA
ncbi:hypothetical protein [Streptomyces gilvus]|uniref:hypothetical protein n=1 Tax=Streptomyces gilvus TaxID=2920937 RepID=UPI001F0E8BDF|nr:hypothetical protein [Streptomyces sp. CME 23]MCH5677234.1 hypothetical protein [Streptomyces sp. CME 23]